MSAAALHRAIDVAVERLVARHRERLACQKGCSACCVDDITVFEVEGARIRERHAELLARGEPHPPGACAFLDPEGACRIYPERPYVCRTQGLPLRWLDHEAEVERRDICELNEPEGATPLTELAPEDCWTLGPAEHELRKLAEPTGLVRVSLRSLFARQVSKPSIRR